MFPLLHNHFQELVSGSCLERFPSVSDTKTPCRKYVIPAEAGIHNAPWNDCFLKVCQTQLENAEQPVLT